MKNTTDKRTGTLGDKGRVTVDGEPGTVINSPTRDSYLVKLDNGETVHRLREFIERMPIQVTDNDNPPDVAAFDAAHGTITKQDWIEAGNAAKNIDLAAAERVLGLPIPKAVNNFEDLCAFAFLAIVGEKLPRCNLRGRGFRSQWYAAKVADVWPDHGDKITATPAVQAVKPLATRLDDPYTLAQIMANFEIMREVTDLNWCQQFAASVIERGIDALPAQPC